MAGSAALNVKILVDAAQAASGLNQVASNFQGFASKAAKLFAGAFVVDKAIDGLKAITTAASEAEQVAGGLGAVFKGTGDDITRVASDMGDAINLTTREYERLATVLGSQLKGAGVPLEDLATQTNSLISLGADLAAVYGGTVAEAVEAVSSAIKGQMDPIERYGVTITGLEVGTRALAIAQADGATAADSAHIAQARLALIYEKTTDAVGAAAAEQDSFQSRLESFKVAIGNLAAEAGGPLLDSFGNLLTRMQDLIPALQVVATAAANLVAGFAQLPTPILLGAAALGAWLFVAPAVLGFFASFGASVRGFIVAVGVARATMGLFAATAVTAGRALLAAFGGPWGVALAAAAAIAGIALIKWGDAARGAELQAERTKSAIEALQQTLRSGGNIRETQYDNLKESLKDIVLETETVDAGLSRLGFNFNGDQILDGMMGDATAVNDIIGKLDAELASLNAQQQQAIADSARFSESGIGVADPGLTARIAQVEDLKGRLQGLFPTLEQAKAKEAERTAEVEKGAEASKEAAEAMTIEQQAAQLLSEELNRLKQIAANTAGNKLLAGLEADAQAAKRAADIFAAATDQIQGRTMSYARAQFQFGDSMRSVRGELQKLADEGTINFDAIANWDIGAINREMPELGKAILDVRENVAGFVIEAFKANGGFKNIEAGAAGAKVQMGQIREQALQLARDFGVPTSQVDAFVRSLGVLDDTEVDAIIAQFILEDYEARKAVLFWQSIKFNPITQRFETDLPPAEELVDKLNTEYGFVEFDFPVNPVPEPIPPAVVGQLFGDLGEVPIPVTPEPQPFVGQLFGDLGPVPIPVEPKPPDASFLNQWSDAAAAVFGDGTGGAASPKVIIDVTAPGLDKVKTDIAGLTGKAIELNVTAPGLDAISSQLADILTRPANIIVTATTEQAWSAVTLFQAASQAISVMIPVNADPALANQVITGITSGNYEATVHVLGDNVPVITVIRGVTTGHYEATITILGDNAPAISAIRALTTGYFEATITIVADADPFWSVYNSLPSSRQVTVNEVPGAVVPAPPGGRMAPLLVPVGFGAAPALPAEARAMAAPGTQQLLPVSGASPVYITISGAVAPDQTARAVGDVLRRRDRRIGGVHI